MIFHRVILFLFYWQCIGGENLENISIESVLDQVAIPTRIINKFLQKPIFSSKKYITNEEVRSSTIHYENANGFVPLIVSTRPYELKHNRRNLTPHDAINGTKKKIPKIIENNPVFSDETRIFATLPSTEDNRRSFQIDDNQSEFELLKVNNDTPAVAKYDLFYNRSRGNYKTNRFNSDINYGKSLRTKDRERGKRIQSYMDNYDAGGEDRRQYVHSQIGENNKKTAYHQEINHYYNEPNTSSYRTQKISPPKTSYVTIASVMASNKSYTPNVHKNDKYRIKNPIMVDEKFRGQSLQSTVFTSTHNNDNKDETDKLALENRDSESLLDVEGTSRIYDSAGFREFSDENLDYLDEVDKPRRVQKTSKTRPYHFDSPRKLPKEHRDIYNDAYDDQGRKRSNKPKSRQKLKSKPIEISNEEDPYEKDDQFKGEHNHDNQQNFNDGNTWNQVAPNVEVSHSNGYEIDQIEKPKLHIVPVNILSNFDHATALDNSQGFDITNAMFTGFVHETPLVSTAAPLISSSFNYVNQNPIPSSTSKSSIGISTSLPDVIVGQSTFNKPIQAVLMPNKLQQNMLNQYLQSTISPTVFAVTPRPGYVASSTVSPNFQQILNQVQASIPINQHIFNAQPTQQPYTNLHQPIHPNAKNQIYVNYNSQGQNLYQLKNSQSTTTIPNSERNESYHKKFNGNNGQFIASASLSVGHNLHNQMKNKNANKRNNYRNNNNYQTNNNDDYNLQRNQQTKGQSSSNFVQPTIVPAILHTGIGLISNQNSQLVQNPLFISNSQLNTPIFKGSNVGVDNSIKQLQYNIKNNRYQLASISSVDNVGGASNNVNAINNLIDPLQKAQLPLLGATNVEIVNPNLNANAYAINQVPATLVTTPIPIFTTTGFISSKQAFTSSTQEPLSGDRVLFNPINFVPNYDLIKSQSVLNSKIVPNDQFVQQNLNLVPVVPGGNFYKHSQGAQMDLTNKPKLSSDLEKYAEEMFKESLRTIYNSHKWNNDPRSPGNISLVDNSDLAKLRNELLRIKNNIRDSKIPKDVLEAHHTENKIRTARPDSSIEQNFKNHKPHSKGQQHRYLHHHHSHHQRHKPEIRDFLTPPRLNSFISKSPFHDKSPKQRPSQGHGQGYGPRSNFNHENSRLRPRQGVVSPKSKGLEAQASTILDYRYSIRQHHNRPDYQSGQPYNYPAFTTSLPENEQFRSSAEYRSSERDFYDINHQRTHNLMGLLMKNKQLPPGTQGNYYNDRQAIDNIFDEENQRMQSQSYKDALKSFQKKIG